jgi:hypothetical protein
MEQSMAEFTRRIGNHWRCTIEDLSGWTGYAARLPEVGCVVELHTEDGERVFVEAEQLDGERFYGRVLEITDARNDEEQLNRCRVQPVELDQRLWVDAGAIMAVIWTSRACA